MLSDVPAEDLLRAVADGLESVVLPALTGAAERRQCRAAIYLTRATANALPVLDTTVDADIADVSAALSLPAAAPPEPFVDRRARRDELMMLLGRALADDGDTDSDTADGDRELLLAVARRSIDRWLEVFPADASLGAFVHLDQTPAEEPPPT